MQNAQLRGKEAQRDDQQGMAVAHELVPRVEGVPEGACLSEEVAGAVAKVVDGVVALTFAPEEDCHRFVGRSQA